VKIGESVVVFGAGGVGLNVIQGAAMVSAHPIIAVDLYDSKLELARKFGTTHLINSGRADVEKEIINILGNRGADVVIDNTGNVQVIELAYRLTSTTGKTILVGVPRIGNNASIHTLPLHFGKELTGTRGGECLPHLDIPRYLRLCECGKLELKELVTDRFSLSEINIAIEKMRSGEIDGRCLIGMN
jgi:S-(hydroxymethyl)glutathione dehydrogenase / alcohol dehydrogenase